MIIGIDPSLTATGLYCEPLGAEIIVSKPFELLDPVSATIERCRHIMAHIDDWLLQRHEPYNFFIEGPAFHDANILLEMGIWYAEFHERFRGVPNTFAIISPTTLKKYIGGKGNLKKEDVPLRAYKKWGVEFANDPGRDKVHAFALFRLGCDVFNGKFDLPEWKRRGTGRKAVAAARRKSRNTAA